jgi:hypothetical protein
MKSRTQQWIVLAVIVVLAYLTVTSRREGLCARPTSEIAADIKAECDAMGGDVVNGQCVCPEGTV